MFNSLWIAAVSSSASITLSAGISSSLVLIMKMRYCTCKPLQLFLAFGLVQRHAFQMQTQLRHSVTPTDAHTWATRVGVCFLSYTSGYTLLIRSNQMYYNREYFRGFILCSFNQAVNEMERERSRESIFNEGFFFFCGVCKLFPLQQQKYFQFEVKQN